MLAQAAKPAGRARRASARTVPLEKPSQGPPRGTPWSRPALTYALGCARVLSSEAVRALSRSEPECVSGLPKPSCAGVCSKTQSGRHNRVM